MDRLLAVSIDGALVEEYGYILLDTRILETKTLRDISDRSFSYLDEDHLLPAGDSVFSYDLDGIHRPKPNPGR